MVSLLPGKEVLKLSVLFN